MPISEDKKKTVVVARICLHCFHEFQDMVTREQLRKIANNEPIGNCPNPDCGLPT